MPLSPEEFADQDDNLLFRSIKVKNWDKVRDIIGLTDDDTAHNNNNNVTQHHHLLEDRDLYDNTPLHAALGYQAPEDILLRLLHTHPDATRVHGANEWLPLHVAAMWGASTTVMTALLLAHPEGLDDKGEGGIKGRTPRHFKDRFEHNRPLLGQTTEEWVERRNKSDKI